MAMTQRLCSLFLRKCSNQLPRAAMSSAASSDVMVTKHDGGMATLHMQRAPVNSLNLEFLKQLNETIENLQDEGCKGMIITSNQPKIFSAGLDIMEMYKTSPERLRDFWTTLQDFFLQLYTSEMATVALINGHSPAGGCLVSCLCDYRVMVDGPYRIGLNETKLGIVAPFWFKDVTINTIGVRNTELMLQLGLQHPVKDALNIGLIDAIGANPEEAQKLAMAKLTEFVKIPAQARYFSKLLVRQEVLQKFNEKREEDTDQFVSFVSSPAVQKGLGRYMESLKKKA